MKNINEKGFAVSTVLYGIVSIIILLLIVLLNIHSGSKNLNNNFTSTIETNLNRCVDKEVELEKCYRNGGTCNRIVYDSCISKDALDSEIFVYSELENEQVFEALYDGYYLVELWGASGAGAGAGKGAYTKGYIELNKNELLYVHVGEASTDSIGGYNGGGNGGHATASGGGGATDIRLVSGTWNNLNSLKSRIMVAGGGGGFANGRSSVVSQYLAGKGGDLYGDNALAKPGQTTELDAISEGGSQISGGLAGVWDVANGTPPMSGTFGMGGNGRIIGIADRGGAGGGGGYYGGGGAPGCVSGCSFSGGGGSSFISGYAGVNAITSASAITASNNTIHYSNKYFINGDMQTDTNTGNGRAVITFTGNKPEMKNIKLNNVRYIKDCTDGSTDRKSVV